MATKLFTNRICPFAQRAEIAALFKGFTGEVVHVGLRADMPEWYKRDINPREEVPAVQLADGSCFSESALIAQYFDESIAPKNQLFPANAELRRQMLAFTDAASQIVGAGFASLRAVGDAELTEKNNAFRVALGRVEKLMSTTSPFAVGASFSYADVFIFPFLIRFNYVLSAFSYFHLTKEFPRMKTYIEACLAIPAVAETTPSAEYIIKGFAKSGYNNGKENNWAYRLFANVECPYCERVTLTIAQITRPAAGSEAVANDNAQFFVTEEVGLRAEMPAWYKYYVNPEWEVPVLRLPSGDQIASSLNAVQYLADEFGADVEGLVPATAEQRLAGRFFVDSIMRVFSEFGRHIYTRTRDFAIDGDVAYELRNAERVFAAAGPAGKTYLFGSQPSYFDFQIAPFLHRTEILVGEERLKEHCPSVLGALRALRADPILGKKLLSKELYFEHTPKSE